MIPLVLVHGFMGGSAQWGPQQEYFAGQIPLVSVDLPGFGQNAHLPPVNRIEAFADWVVAALRAKGVDRYHLLGHSMGGMIAQEIARRDAKCVERLVLYSTGAKGVLPGRFETIAQSKSRVLADGPQQTARRIAATWFLHTHEDPGFEHCAQIAQLAGPEAMLAGLDAMDAWSGEDGLSQIRSKTLVIWGDRDRTYPWQQIQTLWGAIPDVGLSVVAGCAHAVHLEKPDLFNRLLGDFLLQK